MVAQKIAWGIRSNLFMKGCSLDYPLCSNPEGLIRKSEIIVIEQINKR